MKKKIAIIAGISGQDGWYLQNRLLNKNYEIVGLSRKKFKSKKNITLIKTNYDYTELSKIIKRYRPEMIFNLAGESNPRASWPKIYKSKESIIDLTVNFLEIIRKSSFKIKYFNCSSSEIYGINKNKSGSFAPIVESNDFGPNNPYGCFKAACHLLVQIYRIKYDIFAVNGVLFNHDSRRKKGFLIDTIINFCVKNKGNNKKLTLSNSYPVRDFAHADDITEAMVRVMILDKPDDYIISGGTIRSVKQIAFEILKHFKIKRNRLIFLNNKKDVKINDIKIGNNNKIRKATNWKPRYKNKELILKLINENIINA
tara:strand:- start:2373 stop:3311 length:939 start_codon:yes stop_codon:yes gene_type:complete